MQPEQAEGLDALQRESKGGINVRWSSLTGAPSRISRHGNALTLPSKAPARAIANAFLGRYRQVFGLNAQDVKEMRFSREFVTRKNGVSHLTLQQSANGIDVFGGEIKINLDAQGRIINVSGEPVPNLLGSVNADRPGIDEHQATARAAADAHVASPRNARTTGLIYFPVDTGNVRLGWRVTFENPASPDVYDAIVDAVDGTVLWWRNQTQYDHFATHGEVYTSDSPIPNTPKGTSYNAPRDDVPFNGGYVFPHDDLHFDWWAAGARTTTTSNNVDAYADRDGDNAPDVGSRPAAVGDDFTFLIDLTQQPDTYQDAAVANLFNWNNRLHDFFYELGFDEAAGNFQTSNFGLGGVGGDAVMAEAQDNADGSPKYSRCNANMSTPGDGGAPRMQMYICGGPPDNPGQIARDGDLESVVIAHEYTHGVHSRLISSTGNQYAGEGWCDYFGLSVVAEPDDPYLGSYGVGDYLFFGNGNGIRAYPYSAKPGVFLLTYKDLNGAAACEKRVCSNDATKYCTPDTVVADCGAGATCDATACSFHENCKPPDTAVDQGLCRTSVYRTGEIWANTLLIARMNVTAKYGFSSGYPTMNELVIDGMKMSPTDPTLLDGRDALIAADLANNNGANECLIWDAFARMGMGYSAATAGINDINPREAYNVPSWCAPVMQVSAPPEFGGVCPGASAEKTLGIFNTGSGDLIVMSVAVQAGGSPDITVDPLPQTPVFVSADAHVDFTVRCEPTSPGLKTATIRILTNDTATPTQDIVYTCTGGQRDIGTFIADSGKFGDVCRGSFKDLDLSINNRGICDLNVTAITSASAEFQPVPAPDFPLVVHGGDTLATPIRFAPTSLGLKAAAITVSSNDPDSPSTQITVSGNVPAGDVRVTGSTEFGDVCAETLAEKAVSVCNVGKCDLAVTGVAFDPLCADFALINSPFPAAVSPDSCAQVMVRFTPTSSGPKACSLVIGTDDPDMPTTTLTVHANTPPASIDVPPDLGFSPEVIQSIGACTTAAPFPVSNTGKCDLKITSLGENSIDYALTGLPSFPIILLPGHVVGDGALGAVFAPTALDRDLPGTLSVTYVSDPVTGATTTVTRQLCGEGVNTGARVLVTVGGNPVPMVAKIQLQRINANRNKKILDTQDVVRNAALMTVQPAPPCPEFQFHREYGTVSNPVQLLPGSYQVTASVVVNGKRMTKTVGFNVDTCDFNPNIVIDF